MLDAWKLEILVLNTASCPAGRRITSIRLFLFIDASSAVARGLPIEIREAAQADKVVVVSELSLASLMESPVREVIGVEKFDHCQKLAKTKW